GAKGALISISGADVKLEEAQQIIEYVTRNVDPKAQVIWGIQLEPELEKTIRVMIIVTGVTSRYVTMQEETPVTSEEEETRKVTISIPEL
ncbi:cell division protein FtsZ, partial [Thermococci archaeon]